MRLESFGNFFCQITSYITLFSVVNNCDFEDLMNGIE